MTNAGAILVKKKLTDFLKSTQYPKNLNGWGYGGRTYN